MALIDALYTLTGIPATYTPTGGAGQSVTVLLDEEFEAEREGMYLGHDAVMRVRLSQVAAKPSYRSNVTTTDIAGNSQAWEIVDVSEDRAAADFGAEWILKLKRRERPAKT